jgi:hypothetical protein
MRCSRGEDDRPIDDNAYPEEIQRLLRKEAARKEYKRAYNCVYMRKKRAAEKANKAARAAMSPEERKASDKALLASLRASIEKGGGDDQA